MHVTVAITRKRLRHQVQSGMLLNSRKKVGNDNIRRQPPSVGQFMDATISLRWSACDSATEKEYPGQEEVGLLVEQRNCHSPAQTCDNQNEKKELVANRKTSGTRKLFLEA